MTEQRTGLHRLRGRAGRRQPGACPPGRGGRHRPPGAQSLITCPEMFYNDQRAALQAKLAGSPRENAPCLPVQFRHRSARSAIKFARLSSGRTEIMAAMRGFHGRTMGALSATWNKKYREALEPLVPGFSHMPYNDRSKLEARSGAKHAALILEVVQGEGGVYPADPEFLQERSALPPAWRCC